MAGVSLLFALCTLCSGAIAQYVLTQSPSVTVTPGQRAELTCSGNGIGSKNAHWYQQKPGGAPRPVMYNDNHRPSGVPERFSGSNSGDTAKLVIAGALGEDEAAYYCQVWDSNNAIFGGGTQLNVLSGEIKAPTISIFPPSPEEIAGKTATLVCQCQNYYPAALVWSWTVNGQTINTGVDSTRPTKQTENNLFMAASFLSIEPVDWKENKNYTCTATHEGKTFHSSVMQSACV